LKQRAAPRWSLRTPKCCRVFAAQQIRNRTGVQSHRGPAPGVVLPNRGKNRRLTVPAIRYRDDTVWPRISRYSVRSKIQRCLLRTDFPKPAPNQAAPAAAGRVAPGYLFRL